MKRRSVFVTGTLVLGMGLGILWIQGCTGGSGSAGAEKGSGFVFRDKLSEYGFFKGPLKDLQPAEGVIRYDLNSALFTDYAVKDRFIVLPHGSSMRYTVKGVLDFPDSTIIIKNFAYRNKENRKILIETRILARDPLEKTWKVMDYLWDSTQTDAVRHITGASLPVQLLDDQGNLISTVYQVPNTNDCKRCHNSDGVLTPIGPKARNLNLVQVGQSENQLAQWASQGKLAGLPELREVEKLPDWKDSVHYDLNQRVRAYLDINCAHCHSQGGDAMNTGLFLDYQQNSRDRLGIMKSPVSAGGGAGGMNYDIVPGNAGYSILAYRMNSTEAGTAMPELGRSVIHKEAVRMIQQWINQMQAQANGTKKASSKRTD